MAEREAAGAVGLTRQVWRRGGRCALPKARFHVRPLRAAQEAAHDLEVHVGHVRMVGSLPAIRQRANRAGTPTLAGTKLGDRLVRCEEDAYALLLFQPLEILTALDALKGGAS